MKIGRLLRKEELPVMVPDQASCVSACVLILAGSIFRAPIGRIGIHRPYFEELDPNLKTADVDQAYKAMFAAIRKYLSEMNVPIALADKMEVIPPEEIKYLSWEEEKAFL